MGSSVEELAWNITLFLVVAAANPWLKGRLDFAHLDEGAWTALCSNQ